MKTTNLNSLICTWIVLNIFFNLKIKSQFSFLPFKKFAPKQNSNLIPHWFKAPSKPLNLQLTRIVAEKQPLLCAFGPCALPLQPISSARIQTHVDRRDCEPHTTSFDNSGSNVPRHEWHTNCQMFSCWNWCEKQSWYKHLHQWILVTRIKVACDVLFSWRHSKINSIAHKFNENCARQFRQSEIKPWID